MSECRHQRRLTGSMVEHDVDAYGLYVIRLLRWTYWRCKLCGERGFSIKVTM